MKMFFFIFTLLIFMSAWNAFAQPKSNFGAGVIIGTPTGISGKYKLKNDKAIDGALAFNSDLYIHGTYLILKPDTLEFNQTKFGWYYGLGGTFHYKKESSDSNNKKYFMGPRGSIGLSLPLNKNQFEVFAEASLSMSIIPNTELDVGPSIGGRINF